MPRLPSPVIDRHARQSILDGIGDRGQQRIASASIAVVGLGAIGCPAADLLARAGVGGLRLIDRDLVELTNLQRQTLFNEADLGEPKAVAAAERLASIDGSIRLDPRPADLTPGNVLEQLAGVDLVLDGSDNFQTRYLVNDAAAKLGLPLVYAGAIGWRGMSVLLEPEGPCLRCAFGSDAAPGGDTCDTVGVLAPVASTVSAWAAGLALKRLAGVEVRSGQLMSWDLRPQTVGSIDLQRDPECPVCRGSAYPALEASDPEPATLCGQNAVQVSAAGPVDLAALADRLGDGARRTRFMVKLALEERSLTVFADGRAIVSGTTDPAEARSLYARYVGA